MLNEIPLTNEEKLQIERQCLQDVALAEKIDDDLLLPETMKEEIYGSKSLKWFTVGYGLISGVIALAFLRWLDSAIGYTSLLHDIGVPSVASKNLPELLAFLSVAVSVWMATYSWAVEGRFHWVTNALNAQKRASVLHSVVERLTDVLGDAVPDLSDYAHVHNDSEPNRRIDRLLDNPDDEYFKAQPRRRTNG